MLNYFTTVNEHEFGHASHELAMHEDWLKHVEGSLPEGAKPWEAIA